MWHWGNIGSFLAGLSTVVIALAAVRQGPAAVHAWIDAKHAQADRDREEAETTRLDRQRGLSGWSITGVDTFGVTLVTAPEELDQARAELGGYTDYVILRVSEQKPGGNGNRAKRIRDIIEDQGFISRHPTIGEREALERGLDNMGIPRAVYGRRQPVLPDAAQPGPDAQPPAAGT